MVDQTNRKNLIMLFSYIGLFILCIITVALIAIFAGSTMYNPNLSGYDRPVASLCYHDHRL
jgi:hypothetical protein